jgi:hypothetical protein
MAPGPLWQSASSSTRPGRLQVLFQGRITGGDPEIAPAVAPPSFPHGI